ncbi:MAG: ribbon-helix-helix domain-containing protein [Candidatus Nitrosotenuis sp.]
MTKAKEKVSIAVSDDLLRWIDAQIKKRRFANRSHAFEYGIQLMMEKDE